MKTSTLPFLAALLWIGNGAWAQTPVRLDRGKVLLLANENTLEGDIERVGENYRVRRGNSEVTVPGAQVQLLCSTWPEMFRYLRARTNLNDPDERIRLARWAYLNNLKKEAVEEAKAALDMRPTHGPSQQLYAIYLRSLEALAETGTRPASPPPEKLPPVPAVDLSGESLALFTTKIQPILLNTCASCHVNNQGGEFHLQRIFEASHHAVQQRNLASVVRFLNLDRPAFSPLLIKATSAHGGFTQPPIKGGKQSAPYYALQEWVELVAANNPHLKEQFGPKNSPTPASNGFAAQQPATIPAGPQTPKALPENLPTEPLSQGKLPSLPESTNPIQQVGFTQPAQPKTIPGETSSPALVPLQPMPSTEKGDPFSPDRFNRPDPFDPEEFNRKK